MWSGQKNVPYYHFVTGKAIFDQKVWQVRTYQMTSGNFENRYDPSAVRRYKPIPNVVTYAPGAGISPHQSRAFSKGFYIPLPALTYRRAIAPFSISELSVVPSRVRPGEMLYISFKATNSTHSTSIYTVTLKINGYVMAADVIGLPPRSVLPLSLPVVAEHPGYFHVNVNEQNTSYVVYGKETGRTAEPVQYTVQQPIEYRPVESIRTEKRQERETASRPAAASVQASIDNAGNAIETALDKAGDALVFPIVLVVKALRRLHGLLR